MGLTLLFSELQVLLSHLWEKEKEGNKIKEKERREKSNRKGMEGRKEGRKEGGIKMIGGMIRNFNKN